MRKKPVNDCLILLTIKELRHKALAKNELQMNSTPKKCSLIFSTYNWPEALELCMKSIFAQTVLPTEIIIADDGSTEKTKQMIDSLRSQTTIPIKHIWHKDVGFTKTIILNEAIRISTTDYIIQTDGDIILHPKFIEEHLSVAAPKVFIRGSRALINKETTEKILKSKSIHVNFFTSGLQNRMNSLYSPVLSNILHKIKGLGSKYSLLGCNFSYWKKDFIEVNGYNNDILGWGHEDTELAARLIHNGVANRTLKYKSICFHLHHNLNSKDKEAANIETRAVTIQKKLTTCENGYTNKHEVTIWE